MNKLLRILILFSVFLFPILSFNFGFGSDLFLRFLFLLFVAALAVFLFIIEVLKKEEKIVFFPLYYLLFAFLIFAFGASFFSADFYNSLFGFSGENLKGLVGLSAFVILSFLIAQVFNKEFIEIIKPFFAVSYVILAAAVILIFHFGLVFPFLSLSYLPMQLGLFFVIGYFLIVNLFYEPSLLSRFLSIILSVLIFYLLLSFNNLTLWGLFAFGALVNFLIHHFYLPKERRFFVNSKLVVLAGALFFLIAQINFGFIAKMPPEASLLHSASFEITLPAIKEKPIFGWGFNNFELAFAKYKPQRVNLSPFYGVDFLSPKTFFEEIFISVGIIGGAIFLAILALLGFYIWRERKKDLNLFAIFFPSYLLLIGAGMFAPFSSLIFYLLFLLVAFVALNIKENYLKVMTINKEVVGVLGGIFILVVALAFIVRFFSASYYFTKAVLAKEEGEKIALTEQAIAFNPYNPFYIQQYSAYLFNLAKEKTFSKNPNFEQIGIYIQTALKNAQTLTSQYKNRAAFKYYLATLYADARAYADKPEEFLNLAQKEIEEAIALAPRNVIYKTFLGDIYLYKALLKNNETENKEKESLLKQAERLYQEAKAMVVIYAPAYAGLAQVYEAKDDLSQAKQNFTAAVQLDSGNLEYRFNLARVLYNIALKNYYPLNAEEWQLSKAYLEEILKAAPNYSNALYLVALIYEKEGDIQKARDNLVKLLSQLPEGKQKQEIQQHLNSL